MHFCAWSDTAELHRVCDNMLQRAQKCIDVQGDHYQHLLYPVSALHLHLFNFLYTVRDLRPRCSTRRRAGFSCAILYLKPFWYKTDYYYYYYYYYQQRQILTVIHEHRGRWYIIYKESHNFHLENTCIIHQSGTQLSTFDFTTSHSGQDMTSDITKFIRNALMYRCR